MSSTQHRQVMEILYDVAQIAAPDRPAFLERACHGNAELRAEVESLLHFAVDDSGTLGDQALEQQRQRLAAALRSPGDDSDAAAAWGLDVRPDSLPAHLGDYEIIRQIGVGGMGCVYEARQQHPRRAVALKVIKPGLSSARLVQRFRREADVLGMLQHPGIAQVHEAGVFAVPTPNGPTVEQPYFAMELVAGQPLDVFANQRSLGDRERLRLVARVCEAVEHAHQRGVLHRDLKFSNILVQPSGHPKVLDFGVARLVHVDDQMLTLETRTGEVLGTVPYMSPEQVEGDSAGLDARSDVYALGVLCFELLAGKLPYDLSKTSVAEAARVIRFEEPARLSSIARRFRGDVETIVAKALEKDPARRYPTAGALGTDIERYLADEPIVARPPTALQRCGKFARRNPGFAGGIVGMFAILVAGLATTSWFAWQAAEQRDLAATQRDAARREARRVAALNTFLVDDLFGAISPQSGQPVDRTALDVAHAAAAGLEDAFPDDPDLELLFRQTLSRIFELLGDYAVAETHLRRALELASAHHGAQSPATFEPRRRLARMLWRQNVFEEARELAQAQVDLVRAAPDAQPADVARARSTLGDVAYQSGQYEEAETHYKAVRALLDAAGLQDDDLYLKTMVDISNVLHGQGQLEESVALEKHALELRTAQRGPDDPAVIQSLHNLGDKLLKLGNLDEAETYLNRALEAERGIVGDVHPDIADTLQQLGRLALKRGELDRAREFGEQALAIHRATLPEHHANTALSLDLVAKVAAAQGDLATHERCHRAAYEIFVAIDGPESRRALFSLGNVAKSLLDQRRYPDAIELHREVLALAAKVLPPDHWYHPLCRVSLAECLIGAAAYEDAEVAAIAGHADLQRLEHPAAGWALQVIRTLYQAWGRPEAWEAFQARRDAEH